jgi:putative aldouronate transport system permease protein
MKNRYKLNHLIICILLFICTLILLIPILNIFALSFTDPARVLEVKGLTIIPKGFSLINYKVLLSNPKILGSLMNSIFITVLGTIINIIYTVIGVRQAFV